MSNDAGRAKSSPDRGNRPAIYDHLTAAQVRDALRKMHLIRRFEAVSYTHLTLPTILRV